MKNTFTPFDFNLSELHAQRFKLYEQRSKCVTKLNSIDRNLKEVEDKLQQLHKDYANEQTKQSN